MADDDFTNVSEATLEQGPERASRFLLGVNSHPRLRAQLALVGYDQEAHAEGWWLLHADDEAGAPTRGSLALADLSSNDESTLRSARAQAELDSMDEKWFAIGSAVLELAYPTQHQLLFGGLAPTTGTAATANWASFTPRYRAMQAGDKTKLAPAKAKKDKGAKKDKAAKKEAAPAADADEGPTDADALAALARHGFSEALVARVEELVKDATALGTQPQSVEEAEREEEARELRRDKARRQIYGWIRKWSRIAPRVVTRRDWLITLGLAERRKKEKSE